MRVNGGLVVDTTITLGGRANAIRAADPYWELQDTSSPVDARTWLLFNNDAVLAFSAYNDALTVLQANALALYRTGDAIVGRDLVVNRNIGVSGALTVAGAVNGQTISAAASLTGSLDVAGALNARGEINATGGSGTGFSSAPIEIMTTATPRISFHWPGVVAAQIGMASNGTIQVLDNPGTGLAVLQCGAFNCTNVYANSTSNNLGDLTCRGATSFQAGLTSSNDHIKSAYYIYPGAITNPNVIQLSWYLATHSSYGLYTNTGIYVVGPVIGQVYNNHGGYYGFIHTHALTYANPNALDDYEEGDWTPTIEFASGDAVYADQIGSYTKIGRMVFVCGSVTLSEKGTGIGRVAGLPFVPERRVTAPHYLPQLDIAKPTHFEFSYQAPT